MKRIVFCITVSLIVVGFCFVGQAAPIQISYDSFESPNILPATSVDSPNPDGWFDTGHPNTSGIIHETSGLFSTPYGEQALKVWQGNQEGARKNLGTVLEADSDYVISFNVAKRDNRTQGDYRAELWVNGTFVDKVEGIVATNDMSESVLHTFDTSGGLIGGAMELRLVDPASGQLTTAWQDGPYFDNVLLTKQAVPEPSTAILAGLGLMGFIFRRRK